MTITKITIAIATMFTICKTASAQVGCAYCPCTQRLYPFPATICQSECRPSLACASSCISVNLPAGLTITEEEDKEQRRTHPKLLCYSKIAQPNPTYNCAADAIGVSGWIWDEVDGHGNKNYKVEVSDFDSYFAAIGFGPSTSSPSCKFVPGKEKIALYGIPIGPIGSGFWDLTHVARQVTSGPSAGLFVSKEGKWKKVMHGAGDMEDGVDTGKYGKLVKCYQK